MLQHTTYYNVYRTSILIDQCYPKMWGNIDHTFGFKKIVDEKIGYPTLGIW